MGIWIDRKLTFGAYIQAIKKKMETQINALTHIAASIWGYTLVRAREVYTKVIRSAIAYGAGVIHDPKRPAVAKGLATSQNKGLQRVLGAYKATPIPDL